MDKKEISVWNLPEDLDKASFRHWVDAVDIQLKAVHGFAHVDALLSRIRRSTTEITKDRFISCMVEANLDIEKGCIEMKEEFLGIDGINDYVFGDKTRFLST